METNEQNETQELKGAFVQSLTRNNKQIRGDRAVAITEDVELLYKREIENLEIGIKRWRREQENMLDLSPDNALNLKPAKDFDADAYVIKDLDLGVKIRNEEIKLEIAKRRYAYLFGGE